MMVEEYFRELDTNDDHEISKVEMFHHLWTLKYDEKYEREICEGDFEQALCSHFGGKSVMEEGFEPIADPEEKKEFDDKIC